MDLDLPSTTKPNTCYLSPCFMSASIKITYALNPPAGTQTGTLSTSKTSEFAIPASPEGGQTAYYTALRSAVVKAKDQIGDELTAWRDAVGKAELTKETKQTLKSEDEIEEDEEEEGT